ncbi:MAG TPA: hypothetical protein VNZ62_03330 [Capillimicrobium sp.]|nr:hypothetical protein [Capillimicrobium sp.]
MPLSRVSLLAVVAALAAAPSAPAAAPSTRVVTMNAYAAPGTPPQLNKVRVVKIGQPRARRVLVLVPGTSAGGPYFAPVARDIVRRLPGWQVWAVERRENLLEDQSVLRRAKAGQVDPQGLFDYYLGWLGDPAITTHFVPRSDAETGYAREWGMNVAVNDLRAVVRAARRGGRRVALGGHSLGATIVDAYATWDFGGRPGAEDLTGLVFIDGGSRPGSAVTPEAAQASLDALATGSPFLDLTGLGLPWSAGVFNAVGSNSALMDPKGPAILGAWSLLPADLRTPVPATAEASYGYALDVRTGPRNLALVQAHIGHLADSGDPRGWVNDGLTTALRMARVFAAPEFPDMDGTAWYHPRRLTIDAGAVNGGVANPAQETLGVRAIHGDALRTPIYAFATSLGGDRALDAALGIARQAGIRPSRVVTVDASATDAHMDPIGDLPGRSRFLKTVVPFLRALR